MPTRPVRPRSAGMTRSRRCSIRWRISSISTTWPGSRSRRGPRAGRARGGEGMRTARVRPSDWLWKEGGGYYTEAVGDLALRPILPDVERLRDGRLFDLFRQHGRLGPESRVLEAGCGRSPWLPFLNRRFGCRVVGIDIEPHAADLARANIAGAGAAGEVVCGDAFTLSTRPDLRAGFDLVYSMGVLEHFEDVVERISALALYLKAGGRILTTVPNLQGVNWIMQRMADLKTLQV